MKNNQLNRSEIIPASFSLVLVVLLFVTVQTEQTFLLFILIAACLGFINKPVWLIPVYIIASLSTTYFVASDGLGISRLIGFIIMFAGLINLVKEKPTINLKHIIFLIGILVYCFLSSLLSITGEIRPFISLAQNLCVLFLISTFTRVNIKLLSKVLGFTSLIGIVAMRLELDEVLRDAYMARLTSEGENANRFAMFMAQLVALALFGFLIAFESKILRVILFIGVITGVYMLILSGSRSSFFGFLGASLIGLILYIRIKKYKILVPAIILTLGAYLLISNLQNSYYSVLLRYSVDAIQTTGGTGRVATWKELVPFVFNNNPMMGCGLGGVNSYKLAQTLGLEHAAHNFLFDMFIQVGLIGVILFFGYYVFSLKGLFEELKTNHFLLLPLLLFFTGLINGIGETIYIEKHFWNSIGLLWLFSNNSRLAVRANRIKQRV